MQSSPVLVRQSRVSTQIQPVTVACQSVAHKVQSYGWLTPTTTACPLSGTSSRFVACTAQDRQGCKWYKVKKEGRKERRWHHPWSTSRLLFMCLLQSVLFQHTFGIWAARCNRVQVSLFSLCSQCALETVPGTPVVVAAVVDSHFHSLSNSRTLKNQEKEKRSIK